MRRIFSSSIAGATALVLASCLGSAPDPAGAPQPAAQDRNQPSAPPDAMDAAPALAVTVKAPAGPLNLYDSIEVPVTLTPQNGLSGPIQLAVTGLIDGVTATLPSSTFTAGADPISTTVTLTIAAPAVTGDLKLTVEATSGAVDVNQTLDLELQKQLVLVIKDHHWVQNPGSQIDADTGNVVYAIPSGTKLIFQDPNREGHYVHSDKHLGIAHENMKIMDEPTGEYVQTASGSAGQSDLCYCHSDGTSEGTLLFKIQ